MLVRLKHEFLEVTARREPDMQCTTGHATYLGNPTCRQYCTSKISYG